MKTVPVLEADGLSLNPSLDNEALTVPKPQFFHRQMGPSELMDTGLLAHSE